MFERVRARQKDVTGYINCMRGTWLGNPFTVGRYGLKRSLNLFKNYLAWRYEADDIYRQYLDELAEKATKQKVLLGCTCKLGQPCHVDLMIDFMMNGKTVKDRTAEIEAFAKEWLGSEEDEFKSFSRTSELDKKRSKERNRITIRSVPFTMTYYKKYMVFNEEELDLMFDLMKEIRK